MNQHLQTILNFIQQAKHLTTEEKTSLTKTVKDTEKDLSISEFKLEKATAELDKKSKAVDTQKRTLEIEAALEKVRTGSMEMHKSEELKEVIKIVYQQLKHLKINLDHAGFVVDYTTKGDWHFWIADEQDIPSKITHPYFESVWANQFKEAKEKGADSFVTKLNFEEKNQFYNELLSYVPGLPEASKKFYLSCHGLAVSTVLLENVGLYIENFLGIPYSDEENAILLRFGKVFQQTYTRFLDLQKAEVQAREAQIEAALERVRSRTMAMQRSEELGEASSVLFKQVNELGINVMTAGFNIWNIDNSSMTAWFTDPSGSFLPPYNVPLNEYWLPKELNRAKQQNEEFLEIRLNREQLKENFEYLGKLPELESVLGSMDFTKFQLPETQVDNYAFFSQGNLMFITYEPCPESHDIFKRFAKVFEQTYTRFLDLQKAEAQTRESQIELALERVRARTMAMQKSSELSEASFLLDSQVRSLGIQTRGCAFNIYDKNESTEWFSSEMGTMPTYKTPRENVFLRYYEEGQKGKPMYINSYVGDACAAHYDYLCTLPVIGESLKEFKKRGGSFPTQQIDHVTYFRYGYLLFITLEPVPEAHDIFKRFAKVFDQTYTRFLDLQKAEEQAREAQIENALEKVRSRTMAMQKSAELQDASLLLFQQVQALGIPLFACGFNIWDDDKKAATAWMGSVQGLQPPFKTSSTEDIYLPIYEAAKSGESLFVKEQSGKELEIHYQYLSSIPEFRDIIKLKMSKAGVSFPKFQIIHCAFFSQGYLMFITYEPVPTAYDIFKRFAKAFEQTYTRFLDLQKAEVQAREAQIETALERVRSRTMAMQKSDELLEAGELLYRELTKLGIESLTIGYVLMDEKEKIGWNYTANPADGTIMNVAVGIPHTETAVMQSVTASWKRQEPYFVIELDPQETIAHQTFIAENSINFPYTAAELISFSPERIVLYNFNFKQGYILIVGGIRLTTEQEEMMVRFTKVFEMTYRRFLDLKQAEEQAFRAEQDLIEIKAARRKAEDALTELKVTQSQLIQSEKMASLGELTAGIAHEIQNPLNFVNNFSEVSNELIQEIKDERIKKIDEQDQELINEILDDIKQNLEKINHHGKRADAIVKGMLQHSRTSSGQKEPTDINKLTDEYLRLAYHGLRAKDKSFNATLKTDYDENIGNINIILQDIGRVILNLITNAFYATNEKVQQYIDDYEPTVSVSTKKVGNSVEISVNDNGNGIPQKIIDKIFQPFFTTKPTGQGTGLGLSLSYDIVKAHGGELKVETKENKGTKFIITLPL